MFEPAAYFGGIFEKYPSGMYTYALVSLCQICCWAWDFFWEDLHQQSSFCFCGFYDLCHFCVCLPSPRRLCFCQSLFVCVL